MTRMTKSIFALVVLIAMCVSFCVPTFAEAAAAAEGVTETVPAGCPGEGKVHTLASFGLEDHDWDTTPETESVKLVEKVSNGCEMDGYSVYVCKACETRFVDSWVEGEKNGHNWGAETINKPATCTEAGEAQKVCGNCGKVDKYEIKALGHDFDADDDGNDDWVYSNPDYICSDKGVTRTKTCVVCDGKLADGKVTEDVQASEHEWVINVTTKPTCVTVGSADYECANCTISGTVEIPVMSKDDPAAHDWQYSTDKEDGYKAPTCQDNGEALNAKCALCGKIEAKLVLDKSGHDMQDVKAVEATCSTPGHKAYKACTVCGEWDEAYKDKDGNKLDLTIAALNHPEEDRTYYADRYKAPTCAEGEDGHKGDGLKVYDCKKCGLKEIEEVIPRLQHPATEHTSQAPTCEIFGFETDACLVCGEYTTFEMIPPYSHNPENPNNKLTLDEAASVAATCKAAGVLVYTCDICKKTFKFDVAQKDHDFQPVVTPNDCANDGYTQDICSYDGCGLIQTDNAERDYFDKDNGKYDLVKASADAHALKTNWTTHPTCTETGLSLTFCTICGWVDRNENGTPKYVEVPALGHDATAWNAHSCQDVYVVTEKLGKHQVGDAVAPTCTADGYYNWECDMCGASGTEIDKDTALGHSYTDPDDDTKPNKDNIVETVDVTCLADGYIVVKCARCDVKNTDDRCAKGCTIASCKEKTHDSSDEFVTKCRGKHVLDTTVILDSTYALCDKTPAKNLYKCDSETCTHTKWENDPTRPFDINDPNCHKDPHKDDTKAHRAATCTVEGIEYWYCTSCAPEGKDVQDFAVVLPMPEHTVPDTGIVDAKYPDCMNDGKAAHYECTVCKQEILVYGEGEDENTFKAAGAHKWVAATCDKARHCEKCKTEDPEKPALGHKWVEATCEAAKTCSVCNKTEGSKLGHDTVAAVVVDATCTTDGYTYDYCDRCFKMWNVRDYVYALGHDFSVANAAESKAPTCTQVGYNAFDCSRCDVDPEFREVPTLSENGLHKNAAGETFGDDCVAGITDYVCTNKDCDFDTPKHNFVPYDVGGDCLVHAYDLTICLNCDKHSVVDHGQKDAHNWGDEEILEQATLAKDGKKCQKCLDCKAGYKEWTYSADAGVQFDFAVTDMKGNDCASYAGRLKLLVNITAKDAYANAIELKINFNNAILTFVEGKLLATDDFMGKNTVFTAAKQANEAGAVSIVTSSISESGNVELTTGAFVELIFDIKADSVDEDIIFTVDENESEILTNEIDPDTGKYIGVDCIYTAIATKKTAMLGKLTAQGEIGLQDVVAFIEIYSAGKFDSVADVTRDGNINIDDYIALQNLILGNTSELD